MPKDLNSRSFQKSRSSHYHPYAQSSSSKETEGLASKEWEDATCPICMEFPHNAVLLLCSSHDKGCRPYMCDTSYRHSNCLDQYKKAHSASPKSLAPGSEEPHAEPLSPGGSAIRNRSVRMRPLRELLLLGVEMAGESRVLPEPIAEHRHTRSLHSIPSPGVERIVDSQSGQDAQVSEERDNTSEPSPNRDSEAARANMGEVSDLLCPLCRGQVLGWTVIEPARQHLNCKPRSCAQEACAFTGNYDELRKHARCDHPLARPSDVDPVRQRDWRRLERQRDIGDVLSTIQSAMPGATILGDYVIDEDNEDQDDDGDDIDFPGDDGNWWTVYLLFQVFGPAASNAAGGGFPTRMRGISRGRSLGRNMHAPASRHLLWEENMQLEDDGGSMASETNDAIEGDLAAPPSRRRRSRH